MTQALYDEAFKKNQSRRVEYGNVENSFRYFEGLQLSRSSEILDLGCNIGSLVQRMHAAGWTRANGIDVAESAIAFGKQQYPAIADRLRSFSGGPLPYQDSSFDVVTAFDVIEHIPDVQPFLIEIRRVLRPGGIFVFQTPNKLINSVWSTIEDRSFTKWRVEHCSLQTVGSLKRNLVSAGFSSIRIEKFPIVTEYNRAKVRKHLGAVGELMLRAANELPLPVFPNLWGNCRKP